MKVALGLARRGLGSVAPNPAVGCVLVREGRVVGRGWTQPGGRPHAEAEALGRAGKAARGATAYVSLEPCAHHGETPPCADALAGAGIARVVVAVEDRDPQVRGRGLARLRDAGAEVVCGVCEDEAAALNAGFFLRVGEGRPLIALKTATTLDGRIATRGGESRWITGEAARARAHGLRASHDAVMVGIGTALADDPMLDCRLPGLARRSPLRIVVDSRARLPLTSRLVKTAGEPPTWLVTLPGAAAKRRAAYGEAGVEVIEVEADGDGNLDLAAAARTLGDRGLTRVLVEGGGRLAAGLLRARLVDRLLWFRAPRLIGGDGLPAVVAFGVDALAEAPSYRRVSVAEVGDDLMETYVRMP
ncbi:MAG: bifunctional diaminohydroxyphosphoribosylaminopyrimidine deaminase/5-amino-6-(5-phosphoribosylamino)uracil reductase RibD [Alphaproteobacteria bacterium]